MKLLAIETATEACSVALLIDGEIIDRHEVAPRQHNELILPMCENVLAEADVSINALDSIAFGCGPGAFTGVRIAASVAQGIAFAHDLPVIPISTLENLASQKGAKAGESILSAIDARMDEIYWAVYTINASGSLENRIAEQVQAPDQIDLEGVQIDWGLGTGWGTYKTILQDKTHITDAQISASALPTAKIAAQIAKTKFLNGDMVTAENAIPVYLRNNVAHKKQ